MCKDKSFNTQVHKDVILKGNAISRFYFAFIRLYIHHWS